LTDVDLQSGARVALVNQAFVRQMWPEGEPLGRQIVLTSDAKPVEVVGVVGDVRHLGLDLPPRPEVYLPEGLEPWPFMSLVVRGRGDLAGLLRASVAAGDRDQPITRLESMEQRMADSLAPRRFGLVLVAALAALLCATAAAATLVAARRATSVDPALALRAE